MLVPAPVVLEGHGVRLEPLEAAHTDALARAAAEGEQWRLFFTFVPEPDEIAAYVSDALAGLDRGEMCPWVVVESESGEVIGSTRYHDIVQDIGRVEIGYTWYTPSWQRTHVNTTCKLLLFTHAFETLGCGVVGLRTDRLNLRSQRAIEALGAMKDGVIRHHGRRRDGTVRDDVMYSVLRTEWPAVKAHLRTRLWRHGRS